MLPKYSIPPDLKIILDNDMQVYPAISKKSQQILNILKALMSIDYVDMTENHYLQLSKLALYLEEYQDKIDHEKMHNLVNKCIVKCDNWTPESRLFRLNVNNHMEENKKGLRVKVQDMIDVIDITLDNILYTLRVTRVTRNHIVVSDDSARFSQTHANGKFYHVQFRTQVDHNYPRSCAHYALSMIHSRNTLTFLFPLKSKSFIQDKLIEHRNYNPINPDVSYNPEQKQAVLNIKNKSSFPAPYILYGPPGTGKTATLVEAICQLSCDSPSSHILVCTPSNAAADEITRRLLKFINAKYIYRIYSQSKNPSAIDEEIRKCSNYVAGNVVYAKTDDVVAKRIVITTICNSMRLIRMNISKDHFSHLIIDEAGHAIEPDILIPISLVSGDGKLHSQIVLAGDPQQLGPTINSKIASTILGRSILERLMSYDTYQKDFTNKYNPNYITKLLRNYRNHPKIIHLSNKLFYDNELITTSHKSVVSAKFPLIFHGIDSKEEKVDFSLSSSNHKEIHLVVQYVNALLNNKFQIGEVSTEDIGIVTPFALQSKMIEKVLMDNNLTGINVGTVDSFQGQERKIIIMTTVRSQTFVHDGVEHIGFLSNAKRFNVAISRAKDLLIVIGNPNALKIDDKWRMLMKYCKDNKSYLGLQLSSNILSDEKSTSKVLKVVSSSILFGDLSDLFTLYEYNGKLEFEDDYYDNLFDDMHDSDMYDDTFDYYDECDFTDSEFDLYDEIDYDPEEDWLDYQAFYEDDEDDIHDYEEEYNEICDDHIDTAYDEYLFDHQYHENDIHGYDEAYDELSYDHLDVVAYDEYLSDLFERLNTDYEFY